MGLFDFLGGGDKKSSEPDEKYEPPPYVPSQYDEKSSSDLFNFYDPRVRGENLGYADEDLKTMEGQAQDYSTRQMNEAIKRGAAGRRRGTGGTYSGGRDVMRDEAIRGGLEYRSNAMRDIAVRNSVLKHQDQWNAASGMGTFLNNERANAMAKWTGANQGAAQAYQFNTVYPELQNLYSRSADNETIAALAKLGVNMYGRGQGSTVPTVNAGPT